MLVFELRRNGNGSDLYFDPTGQLGKELLGDLRLYQLLTVRDGSAHLHPNDSLTEVERTIVDSPYGGTPLFVRKGTAPIIGALIFFAMVFGTLTPYLLYVNALNGFHDQAVVQREKAMIDQSNERLNLGVVLLKSGHLGVFVNNTGSVASEVTYLLIRNSTGGVQVLKVSLYVDSQSSSSVLDTDTIYTVGRFTVKALTSYGNVYAASYPRI